MISQTFSLPSANRAATHEKRDVPSFDECFSTLRPFFEALERSFEDATREMREFFEEKGRPWDPFFAPHYVRYLVKEHLSARNFVAEDFQLENLAYSGLSIFLHRFHVKIFKSVGGDVPAPGASKPRRSFYAQQQSLLFAAIAEDSDEDSDQSSLNLIILWDFDSARRLARFWLVCPKAGGRTKDSVEVYWQQEVPLLLSSTSPTGVEQTEPLGEDLEISLKKRAVADVGEHE
ncbi:MAG TPA: hypothetical protein VFW30_03275 [Bryocella sp.]|nr:hypothetical protein [Bryocella sp.]